MLKFIQFINYYYLTFTTFLKVVLKFEFVRKIGVRYMQRSRISEMAIEIKYRDELLDNGTILDRCDTGKVDFSFFAEGRRKNIFPALTLSAISQSQTFAL